MHRQLLLFILSLCLPSTVFAETAAETNARTHSSPSGREISVTGEAWVWANPDRAQITFTASESGDSAAKASEALERKMNSIVDAIRKEAGGDVLVIDREITFTPNDGKSTNLKPNAAVRAKRSTGIETTQIKKIGSLIDIALKTGADEIESVDFHVKDSTTAKQKAITEATAQARKKAENVALSLGVRLGEVIESAVTEEPVEKTARIKRERGDEDVAEFTDEESRVFVSLRYEIAGTAS